jgi:hypothetical protein
VIASNTCPYCGGRYGVAFVVREGDSGCENRCATMKWHAELVAEAAAADEGEQAEVEGRQ